MNKEIFPQPPESFKITTGEDEIIDQRKEIFFKKITDFLGYDERATAAFVEQKRQTLGIEDPSGFRASDDNITLLIAGDQVIASVIQRRDDHNYVEVLFSSYLNEQRVKRLKEVLLY